MAGCGAPASAPPLRVLAIGEHDVTVGTTWVWPLHAMGTTGDSVRWDLVRGPAGTLVLDDPPRLLWTPSAFDLAAVPVGAERAPGAARDVVVRAIDGDQLALGAGRLRAVPHPLAGQIDAPDRLDVALGPQHGVRFEVRTSDGALRGAPIRVDHGEGLTTELAALSTGRWQVRARPTRGGLAFQRSRLLISALQDDNVVASRAVDLVWHGRDETTPCLLQPPHLVRPIGPSSALTDLTALPQALTRGARDDEAGALRASDLQFALLPADTDTTHLDDLPAEAWRAADEALPAQTAGLYAVAIRARDPDDDALGGRCAAVATWPRAGVALVGLHGPDEAPGDASCVDDATIDADPLPAAGALTRRLCPGVDDVWTIAVPSASTLPSSSSPTLQLALRAVSPAGWPTATFDVTDTHTGAVHCTEASTCALTAPRGALLQVQLRSSSTSEATSALLNWGTPPAGCTTPTAPGDNAQPGPWPDGGSPDALVACPGSPGTLIGPGRWHASGPVVAARGDARLFSQGGVLQLPADETAAEWRVMPLGWHASLLTPAAATPPALQSGRWTVREGAIDVGSTAPQTLSPTGNDGLRWRVEEPGAVLTVRAVGRPEGASGAAALIATLREAVDAPTPQWPPPGLLAEPVAGGIRLRPATSDDSPDTFVLAPALWPPGARVDVGADIEGPQPTCAPGDDADPAADEPLWQAAPSDGDAPSAGGTWVFGPRRRCDGGPRAFAFAVPQDALIEAVATADGSTSSAQIELPVALDAYPGHALPLSAAERDAMVPAEDGCTADPSRVGDPFAAQAWPASRSAEGPARVHLGCWPRAAGLVVVRVDDTKAGASPWSLAVRIR